MESYSETLEARPAPVPSSHAEEYGKLEEFYSQHSISLEALGNLSSQSGYLRHRFVRLHPAYDSCETLKLLKSELPPKSDYPIRVPWLDPSFGFYALPGDFRLAQSKCYQDGRIYGQDVSSGAAVAALLSNYHDRDETDAKSAQASLADDSVAEAWRVLDLCCAPGLKLCAIADWLRQKRSFDAKRGHCVVGVDCSEPRLATCRKIVQRHQIEPYLADNLQMGNQSVQVRLYRNDATKFGLEPSKLVFDSTVATDERIHLGKRKRKNKSARSREKKRLRELSGSSGKHQTELFDRVLVDAECSTDGSLKHVQKRIAKNVESTMKQTVEPQKPKLAIPQLTNEQRLAELVSLQRGLAESGFRLLKKGGFMVYSTCSLSDDQNEGVVEWLLDQYPSEAKIVPLQFTFSAASLKGAPIEEGSLPGTMRFSPRLDAPAETETACSSKNSTEKSLFGGGFFIAKIKKI